MTYKDPEVLVKEMSSLIQLGKRDIFKNLKTKAYLNYAAFTPPSSLTLQVMETWFNDYSTLGAAAYSIWANQRDRLRKKLAKLINGQPHNIGFGSSTSSLISDITFMLDWKLKDRVLVFNGDFPSVIYPVKNAVKHFHLQMVMHELDGFDDGSGDGLKRIEEELKRGLRLIAVSSTHYHTGLQMPILQISNLCKKYGAELLVDAAQSCGAMHMDVLEQGVDFLIAPTHKWLMGIEGAAFIYIGDQAMKRLVTRRTGWMSYENGLEFLFGEPNKVSYENQVRENASFLELGMSNSIGFAALETGISTHLFIGMKKITSHIQSLHDHLEAGLLNLGYRSLRAKDKNARSSILSFLPPEGVDTVTIGKQLTLASVAISTPDGHLRFAPSWPTSLTEVEYVIDATSSL